MTDLWRRVKRFASSRSDAGPGGKDVTLTRSNYSLVSSTDQPTPGALQLWLGLPEEVKNDPALASFRRFYETKHGKVEGLPLNAQNSSVSYTKRLPLVKSAPHLDKHVGLTTKGDTDGDEQYIHGGIDAQEKHIIYKPSKLAQACQYARLSILVGLWLFFTVVFLMYNEKEEIIRNTSVAPGEVKKYIINIPDGNPSILVKLSGPFLSELAQKKMNSSQAADWHRVDVWVERWKVKNKTAANLIKDDNVLGKEKSTIWTLLLQEEELDFNEGEPRSSILKMHPTNDSDNIHYVYTLMLNSTSSETIPFTINYTHSRLEKGTGVIYAFLLLCGLYALIIFEIMNRTLAAIVISCMSLAVLTMAGERPSLPELISWIDMETLLLLFSMMVLVSIMAETGMFDFLAVYTFQVTKGKMWPLVNLLCAITALISMFLDNVTTVLLMAPVTIRLCEVTNLNPVPILMSMVLYSNIGGTATPVGDPPNVIIASNKAVIQAGVNFTNFTLHMTVGIVLVCVQTYLQLRYVHIDGNKLQHNEPKNVKEVRHQISIWHRAAESLQNLSQDEQVVKERLLKKIRKLSTQLKDMRKQTNLRACSKETFQSTLEDLKAKYKIRDKLLLMKASVAIVFVVVLFFLHSVPELNRISLAWTALLGAILLLILADREDLEPILHRVEWSTLLFFAALFVLMEALSKLGLIDFIGAVTESLILNVDEKARLAVAILLMLWVSGITSAFIDNIPLTTMMVRVVSSLGTNPNLNLPLTPLIWAVSFGACLGGNGTLIGASANVICAGVAEQHGYKFTFMQFFRIGFPVMICHLLISSVYLLICHCAFTWH